MIDLGADPDNGLHRDVMLMATKNVIQAEVQAEALGVSLGPVLEVSEWGPNRSFEHHGRLGHFTIADESREAAFQVIAGLVEVDASIEVSFAIASS